MRNITIFLFGFILTSATSSMHDAVTATFNVVEKGHVLMLEIDFDQDDYLKIHGANTNQVNKNDFSKYLNKTTSWQFDGKKIQPKILSIQPQGHHTKAVCFLSESKKNIQKVIVKNEFLIEVKNHSNIIKLDINNTFKGYRLHKNRKEITVNYN